jgi:tetratricopeptide (TPR) repeat protein
LSVPVEDLIARARRGELDEAALGELEAALAVSLEARLLYRAGRELDAEDSVLAGDEGLAARITARLVAGHGAAPRRPPAARKALVAVCLTAAAAAAAAGPLRSALGLFAESRAGLEAPSSSESPRAPVLPRHDAETPIAAASPSATPEGRPAKPGAPSPKAPPRPVDGPQAAELFANASRARSDGRTADALALYAELDARFPASAEAHAGRLGAGMLELGRGRADEALRHFRRFLAEAPRTELAPEALWGQARALDRLGRVEEARGVWATLLRRYPDSAYAGAARSRVEPGAP